MGNVSGGGNTLALNKKIAILENEIELLKSKLKKKPIEITKNMWFHAHNISGAGIAVAITCDTEGAAINVESAECYIQGQGWVPILFLNKTRVVNQIHVNFSRLDIISDFGRSYLVRMDATITYDQEE